MRAAVAASAALTAVILLPAWSVSGQIHEIDIESARSIAGQLREVDFETLVPYTFPRVPGQSSIPNPLRFDGLTLSDRFILGAGFCSSPTCEPDPDNPQGGNISVFLNPGGTLSFTWLPSVVILDIQGMGANPFTLSVRDRSGAHQIFSGEGVLFGTTWLSLSSPSGIDRIEVQEVGGTGGPLALTRVLFSEVPEPSTIVLGGLGALMLACRLAEQGRRRRRSLCGSDNKKAVQVSRTA